MYRETERVIECLHVDRESERHCAYVCTNRIPYARDPKKKAKRIPYARHFTVQYVYVTGWNKMPHKDNHHTQGLEREMEGETQRECERETEMERERQRERERETVCERERCIEKLRG